MGGLEHFRYTEISNLYGPIRRQEDVGGLDVPVQDFVGVDGFDAQGQLHEPVNDDLLGYEFAPLSSVLNKEG